MKKQIIVLLLGFPLLSCLAAKAEMVRYSVPIGNVKNITLRSFGSLYIKQGSTNSLGVEVENKYKPNVYVESKNNNLDLGMQNPHSRWWDVFDIFTPSFNNLKFYVTIKDLRTLNVSSSGKVYIQNTIKAKHLTVNAFGSSKLKADNIEVSECRFNIAGSSRVNVENITAGKLKISTSGSAWLDIHKLQTDSLNSEISGSGKIFLSGKSDSQTVSLSGSSDYNARALKSKNVNLKSYGSSYMEVSVSDSADLILSGSGIINLYGNPPKILSKITGSGSFNLHK